MNCTICGSNNISVLTTRETFKSTSIRRRRKCKKCGYKFTTYETIDRSSFKVIKRDKSIESFNKQKLLNGIIKSFANLGVPYEKQVQIADSIERSIYLKGKEKISSELIGEEVLRKLRAVNDIAYIRFASVYFKFKNVQEFKDLISQM